MQGCHHRSSYRGQHQSSPTMERATWEQSFWSQPSRCVRRTQLRSISIEKEHAPTVRLIGIDILPHFGVGCLRESLRLAEKEQEAMARKQVLDVIRDYLLQLNLGQKHHWCSFPGWPGKR